MATLKDAINIARKEPDSERSHKLRAAIIAGKMDDIASREGIDLSQFKKVETDKLSQESPDLGERIKSMAIGGIKAVQNAAANPATTVANGMQSAVKALPENTSTPEQMAEIRAKQKEDDDTRNKLVQKLSDISKSGGSVDLKGKGISSMSTEEMKQLLNNIDQAGGQTSMQPFGAAGQVAVKGAEGIGKALLGSAQAVTEGLQKAGQAGEDIAVANNWGKAREGMSQDQIDQANPYNISKKLITGASEAVKGGAGAAFAPISGAVNVLPEQAQKAVGAVMDAPFQAQGNSVKALTGLFGLSPEDAQSFIVNPLEATETALMAAFPVESAKLGEDVLKKTGQVAGKVIKTVKNATNSLSRSAASAASGLNAETISTAIKNPDLLGKAQKIGVDASRQKTLEMVKTPVDKAIADLKSTGSKYNPIREADSTVAVPPNWMKSKLEQAGISVEKGKLVSTSGSKIRSKADLGKLQEVYDMYGKKTSMTNNEFLNLRSDLSGKKLANFGSGTTNDLTSFAKGLRKDLNSEIRPQIQGLTKLDAQASGQIKALKEIKGLIYDKNGLKDNAIQTVNNLLNDAKQGKLNKVVENLKGFDLEGFAQQVKVTKALSDIELAKGVKVGTYGRDILRGGAVMTGNVPVIAGAVLSHPAVLVPLLKAYGKVLGMGTEFAGKVGTKILQGIKPTDIEAAFVEHALKKVDPATLEKVINVTNKVKEMVPKELSKMDPIRFDSNSGPIPTAHAQELPLHLQNSLNEFQSKPQVTTMTMDDIFSASKNPAPSDLSKDGLKSWKELVKQGKAEFVDGRFSAINTIPEQAKRLQEILRKGRWESKEKLTPEEIKMRDEFFDYTSQPQVNAKYEAGAKDPEIINDFLSQKKGFNEVATPKSAENQTDSDKFERAKDLSPENRAVEDRSFKKIERKEGKILQAYNQKYGKEINADNFRQFFKKQGYNGSNSAAVQEPSSYLAKKAFTENLKNDGKYFVATGGGSGAGKSSALKGVSAYSTIKSKAAVILDSNMSSLKSALKKIDEAKQAGKKFVEYYVYRSPEDAFLNGVVKRMKNNSEEMGRIVPSSVVADNHIGSFEVAKQLEDMGKKVYYVDNSLGAGNAKIVSRAEIENKANFPSKEVLTEKLNLIAKKLYEKGEITKEQLKGFTGE